ncbi:MAG: Aspartyl-tRNA synthetase [uncultured Thermoleophilia bacterium]|uniref:Aspartate--tRNA(Asp/Asn) ligase n=1 Tax=uncultured Thermoleophilia bacterium TaxID=1497501 RepID=A0A6J4U7A4_9ACTN|nr:MAG: Aspartyl-tRNA synthetase [uncultured Thermoleophilia bacterium]
MSAAYRTDGCGTLDVARAGAAVTLSGFVGRLRDHGGLIFIDLRDRSGLVQVVVDPSDTPEAHAAAGALRVESVVRVTGTVVERSAETVNPRLATGRIEVRCEALDVLAAADPLPFQLDDENVDEALRIRHRALDLRRPEMTERLRVRSLVTRTMRRFLEERGFWDLETPVLTKSTPEGARDFLVPARLEPGAFYALPQSPQLFKQLYMMAGLERYYQIARCFRDEAQRADRQLEFTQLDVEMAFVEREDVLALTEELYCEIWREVKGVELARPFPRLPYDEAVRRYGSDKPDLRYGLEIADVTEAVAGSGFAVFARAVASGGRVRALACPGAATLTRRELDDLQAFAREWGGQGLAYLLFEDSGDVRSPIAKFLTGEELDGIRAATGAGPGSAVFLAADTEAVVVRVLGALRPHLAARFSLVDPGRDAMAFVVDFPLFAWNEDERRWEAEHHMFTAPRREHEDLLETDPGAVLSESYDFVVNGHEVASGSLRIHRADLQQRVFDTVGFSAEDAEERFGFLLRALRLGAPPHGGIAPGLDRTVMLLCGTDNIRDVIAFPKIAGGLDPLTGAPGAVDPGQLRDLGLELRAPARGGAGAT